MLGPRGKKTLSPYPIVVLHLAILPGNSAASYTVPLSIGQIIISVFNSPISVEPIGES